jgi:hypothetical protein
LRENKIALILDVECPERSFSHAPLVNEESGPKACVRDFHTSANIQKALAEMQGGKAMRDNE